MDALLEQLRSFTAPNVFNPWREDDPLDSFPDGSSGRCERLRAHFSCDPVLLLVGEAPGYQGCHFSGVPFTNEALIMEGRIPRISTVFRLTTRDPAWSEPSATIVWGTLHELGIADRTVLWNSFAWHPHDPDNRLSNRKPKRSEIDAGLPVLRAVLDRFYGVSVVAVGNVAADTLDRLGIAYTIRARHPAYGGAPEFRQALRDLLSP